jgi:hypothetical protein
MQPIDGVTSASLLCLNDVHRRTRLSASFWRLSQMKSRVGNSVVANPSLANNPDCYDVTSAFPVICNGKHSNSDTWGSILRK